MVRQYHAQAGNAGRYKIIARYRGYHGNTLGALSATGQAERKLGYEPLVPGFVLTEAPDSYRDHTDCAAALERTILREGVESVGAFIMEPIQGEGGVQPLDADYVAAARELCTQTGTVMIADEVQCGGGRSASSRAYHQHTSRGACRRAQDAHRAARPLETVHSKHNVGEGKTRRKAPARRRHTCEHTRPSQRAAAPLVQPFRPMSKRVVRGCSWPTDVWGRTGVPAHVSRYNSNRRRRWRTKAVLLGAR